MANDDLSKLKIDKSQPAFQINKRKRKTLIKVAVAFVVLLLILFWTGVFSPATKVEVASISQVYPSQSITILNASGYVVPQRKSAVAAKVTGRLTGLYVEEGSRIKKDQVIAQLENDDLTASRKQIAANLEVARTNLQQAKAELHDATLNFEREKSLLAKEYTTRSSFDAAEARYKKAAAGVAGAESSITAGRAALSGADVSLGYTHIRAPFDAVVLTKNADVGDIVTPIGAATTAKASVVTIADMASLQVEADVSESNIEKLKPGQPCEVQLDAIPNERFPGIIHMIVPTADRTKATVMVKVRFNTIDPRILPEMSAKVAFLTREVKKEEEKPRTAVNPKAILETGGKKVLFVIKQNRVRTATITTGSPLGDMIEVLSGVVPGDKVVLNPPKGLKDNDRIKITEH